MYTQKLDSVSRNHLKLWFSGDYLHMKNIGSHSVQYCGNTLLPGKNAVLKIGGEGLR